MEYLTERSEGAPCIVANCPWFNIKYEQNCQAEFNGEPYVASCVDYAPANIQQQVQADSDKPNSLT